jgi:hypothetical protein
LFFSWKIARFKKRVPTEPLLVKRWRKKSFVARRMDQVSVHLSMNEGEELLFDRRENMTVLDVKELIREQKGVPLDSQIIFGDADQLPLADDDVVGMAPKRSQSWLSSWFGAEQQQQQQQQQQVVEQGESDDDEEKVVHRLRMIVASETEGGCDSGFVCCKGCCMLIVCRPCECIVRALCFFTGCSVQGWNSCQVACCRMYCCPSELDEESAVGEHEALVHHHH